MNNIEPVVKIHSRPIHKTSNLGNYLEIGEVIHVDENKNKNPEIFISQFGFSITPNNTSFDKKIKEQQIEAIFQVIRNLEQEDIDHLLK